MRKRLLHEVLPAGGEAGRPIIEIDDIHLAFAGVKAIDGVTFTVHTNEIFAVIGPNGAGKTSIFNCISGVYHPQEGRIRYLGDDILGLRPNIIADRGVARTFQNIELFPQMTVLDNLMLGRHQHVKYGTAAAMLRFGKASVVAGEVGMSSVSWAQTLRLGHKPDPLAHVVVDRRGVNTSSCLLRS